MQKLLHRYLKEAQLVSSVLFASKQKMDQHNEKQIKYASETNNELTVVIHGIFAKYYTATYPITLELTRLGINSIAMGFDYTKSLDDAARELQHQIFQLTQNSAVSKVNIVGISLGGVVARYYIEKLNGKAHVNKLVTVCSPLGTGIPNELCGADFIRRLTRLEDSPQREHNLYDELSTLFSVPQLGIYANRDLIVRSKAHPDIPTHDNLQLVKIGGGHTFVSFNNEVLQLTARFLSLH